MDSLHAWMDGQPVGRFDEKDGVVSFRYDDAMTTADFPEPSAVGRLEPQIPDQIPEQSVARQSGGT